MIANRFRKKIFFWNFFDFFFSFFFWLFLMLSRLSILSAEIHTKGSSEDAYAMSHKGKTVHLSALSARFRQVGWANSTCQNSCQKGRGHTGQWIFHRNPSKSSLRRKSRQKCQNRDSNQSKKFVPLVMVLRRQIRRTSRLQAFNSIFRIIHQLPVKVVIRHSFENFRNFPIFGILQLLEFLELNYGFC